MGAYTDTAHLVPTLRRAVVEALDLHAEGMEENLRDDYYGEGWDQPDEFPVVEDMRKAKYAVAAGQPVDTNELEVVADQDRAGADPVFLAAMDALGVPVGYRGV